MSRGASTDAVKRAYRRLAKVHHPDRNPDDEAAEARFKDIAAAYEILSSPLRRARWDRQNPPAANGFSLRTAYNAASRAGRRGRPRPPDAEPAVDPFAAPSPQVRASRAQRLAEDLLGVLHSRRSEAERDRLGKQAQEAATFLPDLLIEPEVAAAILAVAPRFPRSRWAPDLIHRLCARNARQRAATILAVLRAAGRQWQDEIARHQLGRLAQSLVGKYPETMADPRLAAALSRVAEVHEGAGWANELSAMAANGNAGERSEQADQESNLLS